MPKKPSCGRVLLIQHAGDKTPTRAVCTEDEGHVVLHSDGTVSWHQPDHAADVDTQIELT